MDGVWAMEGHGPGNGTPRRINLIAASMDAVAMDVGICQILGVHMRSFPLYRAAKGRGIGETDVGQITFKGESPQSFMCRNFQIPTLDSLGVMPGLFGGFTKRFLVSKPVQGEDSCVGCGQCAQLCPADAIEIESKKITFDYGQCIRCYCCQEICPEDAIHFHKGFLVRLLSRLNR